MLWIKLVLSHRKRVHLKTHAMNHFLANREIYLSIPKDHHDDPYLQIVDLQLSPKFIKRVGSLFHEIMRLRERNMECGDLMEIWVVNEGVE